MAATTCTEFVVRQIGPLKHSPKGHPYVECRVDGGTVAFWGSPGNMTNIETVKSAAVPFKTICDCIDANWPQHALWVPERAAIYVLEPLDATPGHQAPGSPVAGTAEATRERPETLVSIEELASWRRQLIGWVTLLEQGNPSADGISGRIGALSRAGVIPREIAALMKAVTEMRNAAEYNSKALSRFESLAVQNAWLAVKEWALKNSLKVDTGV
jgi:hypothetical protein